MLAEFKYTEIPGRLQFYYLREKLYLSSFLCVFLSPGGRQLDWSELITLNLHIKGRAASLTWLPTSAPSPRGRCSPQCSSPRRSPSSDCRKSVFWTELTFRHSAVSGSQRTHAFRLLPLFPTLRINRKQRESALHVTHSSQTEKEILECFTGRFSFYLNCRSLLFCLHCSIR